MGFEDFSLEFIPVFLDGVDKLLEDKSSALILVIIADVILDGIQQIDVRSEQVHNGLGSVGDFLLEMAPV